MPKSCRVVEYGHWRELFPAILFIFFRSSEDHTGGLVVMHVLAVRRVGYDVHVAAAGVLDRAEDERLVKESDARDKSGCQHNQERGRHVYVRDGASRFRAVGRSRGEAC